MSVNISNVVFGLFGMIASASIIIAIILAPFALWKGFKHKKWKLGKILAIMFFSGLVFQIIILRIWGKMNGAAG